MDNLTLKQLNISDVVFLNKVIGDLQQGVHIDSSNNENVQLTKVWTDTVGWQFVIIGLSNKDSLNDLSGVEIQSTGQSKRLLRLRSKLDKDKQVNINFQKLAQTFAQIEKVSHVESLDFIDAYMRSTFNRTLTQKLFDELSHDENYFNWLIY